MFNPLAPFQLPVLQAMIAEGHRYFVRQTFLRSHDPFDQKTRGSFLFCHYKDYPKAKEHFDVLADDPLRFLYAWDDPDHQVRLQFAASAPEGYKLYSNTFLPDWEHHLTDRLKEQIRRYIQRLGWKPGKNDAIIPAFYPYFGEVYVALRFRKQEVRIKFEEIENLR
ncbi:MAG TPA: hypothetical protein VHK91_05335 [Flavisolibacter sp.]|jgi:hypothetical protein|nr:hypothetical protein [Flavisolibacter sp.]